MREIFHGWRRKAGVATLVMACAVMGMWVRSLYCRDVFYVGSTWGSFHLRSTDGGFKTEGGFNKLDRLDPQIGWIFEWETYGFRPLTYVFGDYNTVDYGGIAIPLTLLSAYLILWKPRQQDSRPPQG